MEAVKPLLAEHGLALVVADKIIEVGGRVYVEATAELNDGEKVVGMSCASAREPETKKGMDEAQITGATSSYARKYALNGLFAIDDTKDADATNTHGSTNAPKKPAMTSKQASESLAMAKNLKELTEAFKALPIDVQQMAEVKAVATARKSEFNIAK